MNTSDNFLLSICKDSDDKINMRVPKNLKIAVKDMALKEGKSLAEFTKDLYIEVLMRSGKA